MKTCPPQANTIMGNAEVVNGNSPIRCVIFASTLDYPLEPVFLTIYVYRATGHLLQVTRPQFSQNIKHEIII